MESYFNEGFVGHANCTGGGLIISRLYGCPIWTDEPDKEVRHVFCSQLFDARVFQGLVYLRILHKRDIIVVVLQRAVRQVAKKNMTF